MGTGSPEWPATFSVKVDVEGVEGVPVLPGMTGFVLIRAQSERPSLSPREAILAITAGKGMVYLVEGDVPRPHEVTSGVINGDYVEIRDGLKPDDVVILDGHQVLEPGDRIRVIHDPKGDTDALHWSPRLMALLGGLLLLIGIIEEALDGGPVGFYHPQARR